MNDTQNHDGARAPGGKAVLTCQRCGHESRLQGDWRWRPSGDRVAIECPECGHELTRRPASERGQCGRPRQHC